MLHQEGRSKLRSLGMLILLVLAITLPAERFGLAATQCESGNCRIVIPLVVRSPPEPQLVAPANATQVASLAPELSWTKLITGTYLIQVATEPSFATPEVSTTTSIPVPLAPQATYILGNNLDPVTLYYWRVGLRRSKSYLFSQAWSFTTPVENPALLPPPPQLVAPANHTTLGAREVVLTWAAVPGALYYRVRVENADGSTFSLEIRDASATTLPITGLAAATSYTWRVKALNQYGWGRYQTQWDFRTP